MNYREQRLKNWIQNNCKSDGNSNVNFWQGQPEFLLAWRAHWCNGSLFKQMHLFYIHNAAINCCSCFQHPEHRAVNREWPFCSWNTHAGLRTGMFSSLYLLETSVSKKRKEVCLLNAYDHHWTHCQNRRLNTNSYLEEHQKFCKGTRK